MNSVMCENKLLSPTTTLVTVLAESGTIETGANKLCPTS